MRRCPSSSDRLKGGDGGEGDDDDEEEVEEEEVEVVATEIQVEKLQRFSNKRLSCSDGRELLTPPLILPRCLNSRPNLEECIDSPALAPSRECLIISVPTSL